MHTLKSLALLTTLQVGLTISCFAQEADAPKPAAIDVSNADPAITERLKQILAIDLSVPASPAMAVLGMAGTEVQRPAFPREFAASLVRGFESNGKPKNAFAIDIVPAAMFFPSTIRAGTDYDRHLLSQIAARTTMSLAAAKVEGNNDASQLAAGIRVGVWDGGDPGHYWQAIQNCTGALIGQMEAQKGHDTKPPQGGSAIALQADNCKTDKLVHDLWAQPALYVGYAQGWYSEKAPFKDASRSAKAVWGSFSIGLNGRSAQDAANADKLRALLLLYAARKVDDRVEASPGSGTLVREDRSDFVTRLRFGKEKWHAFFDAGVGRVTTGGVERQRIRRLGLGAEYQLRPDIWLVVGSVRENGYAAGDRNLINTGLRFGQATDAQFGLPGGAKKMQ